MRIEMTKNVGYDEFWDSGGQLAFSSLSPLLVVLQILAAVTPEKATSSLIPLVDSFSMEKTGQYWAPRGTRDVGTAEAIMGKNLPAPLQLPW